MLKRIKRFLKLEKETPKNVYEEIDRLYNSLESSIIQIGFGDDFLKFDDAIRFKMAECREKYANELGFIFPLIEFIDEENLQENQYILKIRNKVVEEKFVIPNETEITKEIALSFENIINNYVEDICTYEVIEKYIGIVQRENAWLIWNLTNTLSIKSLRQILINLLKKKHSIKDINFVFEKIYENSIEYNNYCGCYGNINVDVVSNNVLKLL